VPEDATRRALSNDWFQRAVRFGHGAKAAVFGILGLLVGRLALGARGAAADEPDVPGALEILADHPLEMAALGILALGLLAYSAWRFAYGLADLGEAGGGLTGWARRGAMMAGGLAYAAFGVYAVALLLGVRRDADGLGEAAAMVLGLPLGQWLVGAVGVGAVLGGLHELFVALTARFREEFVQMRLSSWERVGIVVTGSTGHAARGAVYVAAGVFGVRAAVRYDPDEAAGFADTIRALGQGTWGVPVLLAIAAGLVAFGAYSLLLAVHRHIPDDEGRPEPRLP